jgi:glycosyltransferase involved in cell wall biosynthesis
MRPQIRRIVVLKNELGELGGVSQYTVLVARELARRGYDVEIGAVHPAEEVHATTLVSELPSWTLSPTRQPRWVEGVDRASAEGQSIGRGREQFVAEVGRAAARRFERVGGETLLLVTQLFAGELVRPALPPLGAPGTLRVIGQYHSSFGAASGGRDLARARKTYLEYDRFQVLTADDAALFRAQGFPHMRAIANPVESPLDIPPVTDRDRRVVSLGRYGPEKSLDFAIRAWSIVSGRHPGWHLDLWGEGEERPALTRLVHDYGLEESVHLRGSTTDVPAVLQRASLSVQTSQFEGLPLALLEAAAYGVPSVAFECSAGVAQVVRHEETGLAVAPNDLDGLAAALDRMIADDELRHAMALRARRMAVDEFSPRHVGDELEALFDELRR